MGGELFQTIVYNPVSVIKMLKQLHTGDIFM
jgi:hypothetical protein